MYVYTYMYMYINIYTHISLLLTFIVYGRNDSRSRNNTHGAKLSPGFMNI